MPRPPLTLCGQRGMAVLAAVRMMRMLADENSPAPNLVSLAGDVVAAYVTKSGQATARSSLGHATFVSLGKLGQASRR